MKRGGAHSAVNDCCTRNERRQQRSPRGIVEPLIPSRSAFIQQMLYGPRPWHQLCSTRRYIGTGYGASYRCFAPTDATEHGASWDNSGRDITVRPLCSSKISRTWRFSALA